MNIESIRETFLDRLEAINMSLRKKFNDSPYVVGYSSISGFKLIYEKDLFTEEERDIMDRLFYITTE